MMWNPFVEERFITLTNECGCEATFLLQDIIEFRGADYLVLMPLTIEYDEKDEDFLFFRTEKDEHGEYYCNVTDKALLRELTYAYEKYATEMLRLHGIDLPDPEEP